jgi:uncharacterized protein YndB with AHSA1/START domain
MNTSRKINLSPSLGATRIGCPAEEPRQEDNPMHADIRSTVLGTCFFAAGIATAARAAVTQSTPDGFLLTISAEIAAPPSAVYAALGQVGNWWSSAHTWSGDAKNLSLQLEAGTCYCERWPGGSVEHARVVFAKKDEILRLNGALGPLQPTAVSGVVTFELKPTEKGSRLEVTHRVGGDSSHALDKIAPFADKMLGEQIERLKKFVETGKPD